MQKTSSNLIIFGSAILFGLAFLYPYYLAPLIILSYSLLFYISANINLTFLSCFLWGFVAFGINLSLLLPLFITYAYGKWRMFFWFTLIIYSALNFAIWWFLGTCILERLSLNYFSKLSFYILWTYFFIIWIDCAFLVIFGLIEGYCCFHPLVPFMEYSFVRWCLYLAGSNFLTLILLIFSALLCTILNGASKKISITMLTILMGIFLRQEYPALSSLQHSREFGDKMSPKSLHHEEDFAHAHVEFKPVGESYLSDDLHKLHKSIISARQSNPNAKIIIVHESAFAHPLNINPSIIGVISSALDPMQNSKLMCILGAHRQDGNNLYNTCYCIDDKGIVYFHDKQHTLFFAERHCPFFSLFGSAKQLFLNNANPFICSNSKRGIWHIGNIEVVPYICSELFFSNTCTSKSKVILALVNDAWYITNSMKNLLFLAACHKIIDWKKSLIYSSQSRASYVESNGNIFFIK